MAAIPDLEPKPLPTVEKPSNGPDEEGLKSKAHQYKHTTDQAKEEAKAQKIEVPPESPKPAAPKKPETKPAPQVGKGQAPAATGSKHATPPKPGEKSNPNAELPNKPAPPGPAAASAQASVAAEVAEFFQKAPKDPTRLAVGGNIEQLVKAVDDLKAKCPPIGKNPEKKEPEPGLLDKAGLGKSPYDSLEISPKLKRAMEIVSRTRDFLSELGTILGYVGLAASIIGIIIAFTGIGAAITPALETLGNVITVVSLVINGVCLILGSVMQALIIAALKSSDIPPNAPVRKELGRLLNEESAKTATALIGVVMGLPVVNKIVEIGLGAVLKMAKTLLGPIFKLIGKGASKLVKGLVKRIAPNLEKGALQGALKKKMGSLASGIEKKASGLAETRAGKLALSAGKKIEQGFDKVAGSRVGKLASRFGKGVAKGYRSLGRVSDDFVKKSMGVRQIEKLERGINYASATAERHIDKALDKAVDVSATKAKAFGQAVKKDWQQMRQFEREAMDTGDTLATGAAREGAAGSENVATNEVSRGAAGGSPPAEKVTPPEPSAQSEVPAPAAHDSSPPAAASESKPATSATEPKPREPASGSESKPESKPGSTPESTPESKPETAAAPDQSGKSGAAAPEHKTPKEKIEEAKAKAAEHRKAELEQGVEEGKKTIERVEKDNPELMAATRKVDELRDAYDVKKLKLKPDDLRDAESKLDELLKSKKNKADYKALRRAERNIPEYEGKLKKFEQEELAERAEKEAGERAGARLDNISDPSKKAPSGGSFWGDAAAYEGGPDGYEFAWKFLGGENPVNMPTPGGVAGEVKETREQQEEKEKEKQHEEWMKQQFESADTKEAEEARQHAAVPMVKLSGVETKSETEGRVTELLAGVESTDASPAAEPGPVPASAPDAQAEAAPPAADSSPSESEGSGPPPPPSAAGAVPYWPDLINKEYPTDLKKLADTKKELEDYKKEQIEAYKQAVGLEKEASEAKSSTEKRQKPLQENQQHTADDNVKAKDIQKTNLNATDQSNQADAKNKSAGNESSKAEGVNTTVPEPPEEHHSWWQRFKDALNFIKKWILKEIAKGMAYIQQSITNLILKGMHVDPKDIGKLTGAVAGQAEEDQQNLKEADQHNKETGAKDKTNLAKATEGMSEAKKLQVKTQQNVNAADQLLQQVTQAQDALNKELVAGKQYLDEVNAATKAEEDQRKQQAAQDQQQENSQQVCATDPAASEEKPDLADPVKAGLVKQAAQIVRSADIENSNKLEKLLAEGSANVQAHPAAPRNPQAVAEAASAFKGDAGMSQKEYQRRMALRASKLDQIVGKSAMTSGDVVEAAHEVEQAAAGSDSDFEAAKHSINQDYETSYTSLAQCYTPSPGPSSSAAGAPPPN